MADGSDLLTAIGDNLRDFGMRVARGVELPDGPVADLFGSRTYFSWKGLVILSQHVAACDYGDRTATAADARALFDAAFRAGGRNYERGVVPDLPPARRGRVDSGAGTAFLARGAVAFARPTQKRRARQTTGTATG